MVYLVRFSNTPSIDLLYLSSNAPIEPSELQNTVYNFLRDDLEIT